MNNINRVVAVVMILGLVSCGQQSSTNPLQPAENNFVSSFSPDNSIQLDLIEKLLSDQDKSNDALLRLAKSKGGLTNLHAFILQHQADEQLLQKEFRKYGVGYSSDRDDALSAQDIGDCEMYFPPEDRNKSHFLPLNLMSVEIDASGRPSSARKAFPPLLPSFGGASCRAKVGNLFLNESNPNYQGGHLIGAAFGGYGGRANLAAPQNSNFNQGVWRETERALRGCRLINLGQVAVEMDVTLAYPDDTSIIPEQWNLVADVINARRAQTLNFRATYANEHQGGPDGRATLEELRKNLAAVGCGQRGISLVVDDTGSMGNVLNAVSASLTEYIASIPEEEDIVNTWNLTTFKDDVSSRGTTTERNTIISQVNSLYADGGDDCPENVLGGIRSGLSSFDALEDFEYAPRDLVVVTDASAQPGDVDSVIAAAKLNGSRVNVLLTGDCDMDLGASGSSDPTLYTASTIHALALSSRSTLKRIADETGGAYYYIPGGTQQDFTRALQEIFVTIEGGQFGDIEPPVLNLTLDKSSIWPPNHRMVEVRTQTSVTDNFDTNPKIELVGVDVSEPHDGQGDGHTTDDIQVTSDGRIFVRAERSARGNGRVYTVTYRATDASDNVGYASATVLVPKAKK